MPSTINATLTNGVAIQGDNSGALALQTNNGTTAVTIDISQNVGIGTSSPSQKLQVTGNVAIANGGWFGFGDVDERIAGDNSGFMQFFTNGLERMRIDSSGNLLVGTTSRINTERCIVQQTGDNNVMFVNGTSTSQTADILQLRSSTTTNNGAFKFLVGFTNSVRFQIFDSGNMQNANNSYAGISDIKLKENIVDATPKLDKLMQVKVRNYNLIGEELKQIGVVAQELESIFPSLIEETADKDADGNDLGTTTKAVKYSVFVPMLIKAIQELNAKVEAQAARIAELEGAK